MGGPSENSSAIGRGFTRIDADDIADTFGGSVAEKTIAQKLFIKEGMTVLLLNAPAGYAAKLGKLPKNASIVKQASARVDFIQLFVANRKQLEEHAPRLKKPLNPNGMLWICYL